MNDNERLGKRPSLAERRVLAATGLGLAASLALTGCSAEVEQAPAPVSSEQTDNHSDTTATENAEQSSPSPSDTDGTFISEPVEPTAEASAGDTPETSGKQPNPPGYAVEAPSTASLEIKTGQSAQDLGEEIIEKLNQWKGTGQNRAISDESNDAYYYNETEDYAAIIAEQARDAYGPALFGEKYDRPDNGIIVNEVRILTEQNAKQFEQYVATGGEQSNEVYNGWWTVDGQVEERVGPNGERELHIPITEWATVDNIVGQQDPVEAETYTDGSRTSTFKIRVDETGQYSNGKDATVYGSDPSIDPSDVHAVITQFQVKSRK